MAGKINGGAIWLKTKRSLLGKYSVIYSRLMSYYSGTAGLPFFRPGNSLFILAFFFWVHIVRLFNGFLKYISLEHFANYL